MSGFYGDLSPQQEEALTKFKDNLKDVWRDDFDDYLCLRFLRARKFNVDKAEIMFRNNIEFRKKWGADTILESNYDPPEVIKKHYPDGLFGVDREGHPIAYQNSGNTDVKGLILSTRREELNRHVVYNNELLSRRLAELSEQHGKVIETVNVIIDMEHLTWSQYYWPGVKAFQDSAKIVQNNYPEMLKCVFVIRAPRIFPIAFNVVKPFLDEKTTQKVRVLGSDWKEELQKYIDPDNLPEAYGGNRREPDAECTKHICHGGRIPEEYYLSNQTEASAEDFQVVQVGRGSSVQLEYHVEVVGTAIKWEFLTTTYDIGFGVLFKEVCGKEAEQRKGSKESWKEIIVSARKDTHLVPEAGTLLCEKEGLYVLRFDNTYSWARSKEVRYSVSVLPPDPELVEHSQFMGVAGGRGKDRVAAGGEGRRRDAGEKEEGEQEDFKDAEDQEEVQPLKDLPSSSKEPSLPPLASEDVNSEAIQRDVPSDEVSNQTTPNGQEQCAGDTSAGNQEGVVCSNSDKESTEVTAPMSSSD